MKKKVLLYLSLALNLFFLVYYFTLPDKSLSNLKSENDTDNINNPQITPQVIAESSSKEYKLILVTKVIDGDTIKLENGQIVRYIGIDTPETVDPRKTIQCFGKEASDKNKELVEGKKVKLQKDVSETDRYGRLLRYVWVNTEDNKGVFVNDYLVKQGYARAVSYPPDIKFQDLFNASQNYALENNIGLWSKCVTNENTPTIKNVGIAPSVTSQSGTGIVCTSNYYNCSDFKTQAEAQKVFDSCSGIANDIHKLDGDGDGKVCEALP